MPENGTQKSVNSPLDTCKLRVVGVKLAFIDTEMQLLGVIKNSIKEYIVLGIIFILLDVIKR
tara:strand:- start:146 stop:331 length:186 start_codon:yes stop_codon:yes gene_type:complete